MDKDKENKIMDIIETYGQFDGGHHKQWCLDQIVRVIKNKLDYDFWVKDMEDGGHGPGSYTYDEGITP